MTTRVVFVNRSYWPDETATAQLLTDLAEGLAARGRSVVVITSLPPGCKEREQVHRGVRIVRIASKRGGGRGILAKALEFFSFHLLVPLSLASIIRRSDAVVALTDPPLIGVSAAAAAGMRGAKLYHWVQDIYPEVAVLLSGWKVWRLFDSVRDGAWRRARGCVTLGTDMAALLVAAGVTPEICPNWAPAGLQPPDPSAVARVRDRWGLAGQFIVGYSGNLGRVHDLEAILGLAEELRDDPGIWFVLVGGGPGKLRLQRAAAERGLTRLVFFPAAPRADLPASLAAADLQLVTLLPGCECCVFPSKLYGVAAVGRPVLFIGPPQAEIARLVVDHGFGQSFGRNDLWGAACAIRALAQSPALLAERGRKAIGFAAQTPGASAAAAAWDGWLFQGPNVDPERPATDNRALPSS